jgi:hypothetical protein
MRKRILKNVILIVISIRVENVTSIVITDIRTNTTDVTTPHSEKTVLQMTPFHLAIVKAALFGIQCKFNMQINNYQTVL